MPRRPPRRPAVLRSPELLRELIEASKYSQASLGRKVDCSKQTINRLCMGRLTQVTEDLADAIADALAKNTSDLFVLPGPSRESRREASRDET